jgi:hypothetical protein
MNKQTELETGLPQENAAAGQVGIDSYRECPAYRIFGIAAFIPTPAYGPRSRTINRPRAGQAGTGQGILLHFCKFFIDLFQ